MERSCEDLQNIICPNGDGSTSIILVKINVLRSAVSGNDLSLLLPLIVNLSRNAFGTVVLVAADCHNAAKMCCIFPFRRKLNLALALVGSRILDSFSKNGYGEIASKATLSRLGTELLNG